MVDYKLQKVVIFMMAGMMPLLILMILLLAGFPTIGVLFIPMVTVIAFAYAGHVLTSRNVFIRAIQGEGLLAFDFNSSGISRVFLVNVDVPDLIVPTKEGKEKRVYDRMISLVLREPEKGSIAQDKDGKKLKFEIPIQEYQKSVFKCDHLNFLIFNSQTGMFLTKEFLANMEKTLMVEYVTLNEWRELKEMNKTIRDFTRSVMDTVLHKVSGQILSNPIVKILAVVIFVLIVIALAVQVAPLIGVDLIPKSVPTLPGLPSAPTTPLNNAGQPVVGLIRGWF